eukprot:15460713-Alexandrium_andersonii.AAC.1
MHEGSRSNNEGACNCFADDLVVGIPKGDGPGGAGPARVRAPCALRDNLQGLRNECGERGILKPGRSRPCR